MRSAVKASAAKAKGVKVIDEKYLGTHQIADQAIDVRESGAQDSDNSSYDFERGHLEELSLPVKNNPARLVILRLT